MKGGINPIPDPIRYTLFRMRPNISKDNIIIHNDNLSYTIYIEDLRDLIPIMVSKKNYFGIHDKRM